MQDKINRFNAAFVRLAAAYVELVGCRLQEQSARVFDTEKTQKAGVARIVEPHWQIPLTDQVRIADCLAVSVGRIEDRMEREAAQERSTERTKEHET